VTRDEEQAVTRGPGDWLYPLRSDHRRHVDVTPLIDLVGDAKVVALGEAAHNIEDFLQVRNDLLRVLVTQCGFTAVVMESGFAEGLAVDAYVQGGAGDADRVARESIGYRFGECAPAVEQLTWMREHNASDHGAHAPVHWYGMDLPGDSTSPEPALRACLSRIAPAAGDLELLRRSSIGRRARAAAKWGALPSADRERIYAGIDDVVRRAQVEGDAITRHCATALLAFVAETRWTSVPDDREAYPRDAFMADTVRWVLQRHERVLVCAHNGHLQRALQDGRPMLGHLLAAELGSRLLVIGQTYGAGPEVHIRERSDRAFDWDVELREREPAVGSLESLVEGELAASSADPGRVPAYVVRPDRGPAMPMDVTGAFDAVVHHRRVRQVPGAFERLREDVGS
jgi:erythromycin esterase-like protein